MTDQGLTESLSAQRMDGNTILLHFHVDSKVVINGEKTQTDMFQVLEKYVGNLSLAKFMSIGEGFLILYTGLQDSFVTVRGFVEGMISVTLEHLRKEKEEGFLNTYQIREMAQRIAQVIDSRKYETLPPLNRGSVHKFEMSCDRRRIIGYNIDEVIFREKSPYQEVMIVHSASYGNMLFIDGWINHSSKDLVYTETLMQRGKEDYCDKNILVLGGGDGSTLCELLKENPKFVLMIDIDEVVIRACRVHLREVNNGVLDNFKGPNHEIIIGDCVKYLKKFIEEGRKFDFVFGCLSDFPYSDGENTSKSYTSTWSFLRNVMNLSFKVLKPSGKYVGHCAETLMPAFLKAFDDYLQELDEPLEISADVAWVPSFMEFWQFYQIWRKKQ